MSIEIVKIKDVLIDIIKEHEKNYNGKILLFSVFSEKPSGFYDVLFFCNTNNAALIDVNAAVNKYKTEDMQEVLLLTFQQELENIEKNGTSIICFFCSNPDHFNGFVAIQRMNSFLFPCVDWNGVAISSNSKEELKKIAKVNKRFAYGQIIGPS